MILNALMLLASLAASLFSAQRAEYAKLSPFEAIRWVRDAPEVQVGKRWYAPKRIDTLDVETILEFCRGTYGNRAIKRFEEDLVEVLARMGANPGEKVDLELVELDTGEAVALRDVPMTEQNRWAIWTASKERKKSDDRAALAGSIGRVQREHAKHAAPEMAELTRVPLAPSTGAIERDAACEDLDALEWLIETRYAYRDRAGFDYRAALDAVRIAVGERIDRSAFTILLAKVLARFGDGHTRIDELQSALGAGFLPCLVEPLGNRLLALKPDRSSFVDAEHPVLSTIDGIDVERWIDRAATIEAAGSATFVRRRAMRGLRCVEWLRGELAANGNKTQPGAPRVELGLTSLDGKSRRAIALPLATERPIYGQRIRATSRKLDGNVGYLRIASMDDDAAFLDALDASMASFRDTRGLVIDVRGNGGGSRAALVRLFPYFMSPSEPPYVANVAAARLAPAEKADAPEGYLADRWLFPPTSSRCDERDRAVIAAIAARFVPEWKPAAGEFSAWHYLVLRRTDNPKSFHYDKPVVVLLDADCFSATDVFLSALAGRPGITLVGETSGGGSGRAIAHRLPSSRSTVRLSSMVSFRTDGRLIDGRGVEPDVHAEPAPTDFIGRGDAMIDAALARLR
jgi:hypothetical protein